MFLSTHIIDVICLFLVISLFTLLLHGLPVVSILQGDVGIITVSIAILDAKIV
jgi:hypothetical protein